MWIVRIALNRPYTFVVLALLILGIGPLTIARTPTDIFPNIDIPVVSVIWNYGGLSAQEMADRIISNFERSLTTAVNDIEHIESTSLRGISVVKVFLHESKEEQRQRLQERLDDPEKRWKFRAGDLDDRALWDDFEAAYEDAIRATSTEDAPWYVVPADHNWSRNLCVAEILVDALERLDPKLPEPVTDKVTIL